MRKLWAAALTPLLGLALLVVGSSPANAFGSEVLGCQFSGAYTWTAGSCTGYDSATFSIHNLSGPYTYAWTLPTGISACTGTYVPCYYSGCTYQSSSCSITDSPYNRAETITVSVRITQSGLSRTLQASATYEAEGPDPCRLC